MYTPHALLFQWHITERCNLRCSHCYQDNYAKDELSFEQLLAILEQYKALLATFEQRAGYPIKGHITVTGGEPFVRQDFLQLLEIFATHSNLFSFAILTNGSFIDKIMAKRLAQLKPRFVQVSIEGTQETHDHIRGKGHFAHTVSALNYLRQAKLHTLISFTAHRKNYQQFPAVAKLGKQLKVNRVWADRLIPQGSGANEYVLTPEETKTFFQLMQHTQKQVHPTWFNRTEVAMHRALQFLVTDQQPYHCTAGDTLLTVQPNGDVYPCRRMPIRVGNLLETNLLELYDHSKLLIKLRDSEQPIDGCEPCTHKNVCLGGLKCLSYAMTGTPFKADPGCWLTS